ncbi:hypothetical protein J5226_00630 [Lysobacter sp. K5869]|uniref:hypothetical protein n=1 Tax=Lysobacter sp. K5869 TaxID=2820808 RepID=UPI001C06368E|nr:hypothetical protein [Lysobacter sp. K5869]QWP76948.1 hypothetical protein J5226_00630 [Lysobacter sp. K5869]
MSAAPLARGFDAATAAKPHFILSEVSIGHERLPDRNGFVTALGVRALRRRGLPVPAALLDALERCCSARGGFRFWPQDARPEWAPDLPDDADDTAIMLLELVRAGRVGREEARRVACLTIARRRVAGFPLLRPPWLRPGVFATWSREGIRRDLVDCTATANALALFAALDLSHLPGVREAGEMLAAAVEWAGDDDLRAASLSPFYPDPAEFALALDHAAECGARGMQALHRRASATAWGCDAEQRSTRRDHAVCGSPYGVAVWRSPELARLREWAQEAMRASRHRRMREQSELDEQLTAMA